MKDIQQLIKRDNLEGGYKDIFPKTFIDAITDRESGTTLTDILSSFNMYFLSYTGSRETTRLEVPMSIRKQGLCITYVLDGNTITEWYGIDAIDDVSWQDGKNWRLGSNIPVVQELGEDENAVISQKGVTFALYTNYKNFVGSSDSRPSLSIEDIGYLYYDSTLKKYICWNGDSWTNMDGTSL